ncbi:hypothetical protein [Pseudomonas sp. CGJS7]|uniref:hypothetical protein n=1 Tax=Pseudomonas sp. CGJS7 TaxID=3109348 RepID=UPI0030090394
METKLSMAFAATICLAPGCADRTAPAPTQPTTAAIALEAVDPAVAFKARLAMGQQCPKYDGRDHSCLLASEAGRLASTAGRASRDGNALCFKTDAAAPVCLRDRPAEGLDSERDYDHHWYLGRLSAPPLYVVEHWRYENSATILIDAVNGAISRVAAPPVASPDGERIAVASTQLDPKADSQDRVVYRLAASLTIYRYRYGIVHQEFEVKPDGDWGPGQPRWLSPSSVEVPVQRLAGGNERGELQATGVRRYELIDERWREHMPSASKPVAAAN